MNKKYPSFHNLSTEPYINYNLNEILIIFLIKSWPLNARSQKHFKEAGLHSGCPRERSPPPEKAATSGSWSKHAMFPLSAFGNLSLQLSCKYELVTWREIVIFFILGGWRRPRTTTDCCVKAAANLLSRSIWTSLPTDFSRATNLTTYSTVCAAL